MWNALRATRGFLTTIELAVAASTDTVQVSRSAATRYLNALDCAGYLTTAYRLRQTACYRLAPLYNTGPKAPALVGRKGLFDFNRAVNVTASQNRRVA